jgi:redox-sensitive bicupin YhaK (pirin superfamily)
MKLEILPSIDRGLMENKEFKGFTVFSNGRSKTKRRDHFGSVYVLNDDFLYPGSGLGMHPHANVEIVTVMLSGTESHEDTLGIHEEYGTGDVQLISSGSGLYHAGGNTSQTDVARHLQIWVTPKTTNTKPAVAVRKQPSAPHVNDWELVVSPDGENDSLKINQNVLMYRGQFHSGNSYTYSLQKKGNGVLIYILQGEIKIDYREVKTGDTLFINDCPMLTIDSVSDAEVLLIETAI